MTEFPGQLAFEQATMTNLGGAKMTLSSLALALKVTRNSSVDFYDRAIELHLDTVRDNEGEYVRDREWWDLWEMDPVFFEQPWKFYTKMKGIQDDRSTGAEWREDSPRKKEAKERWLVAREEWKKIYYKKIRDVTEKIKKCPKGSDEWRTLKTSLISEASQYELIPERRFFLQALEIEDIKERSKYLTDALAEFYKDLNHTPFVL